MERVLDLGIGSGGTYLETSKVPRVGLDIERNTLVAYKDGLPGDLVVADAETRTFALPFKSESFYKIECYFPHDELLAALCDSKLGLWSELGRVLTEKGSVQIILDKPIGGQGNFHHGKASIIWDPELDIADAAKSCSFSVEEIRNLPPNEVKTIGSFFSRPVENNPFVWTKKITARKQ